MADPRGFLKVDRSPMKYRPVCERVQDYNEVFDLHTTEKAQEQASRCMDCGTPFCHWGCPVGNYIPEWNDYIFQGNIKKAYELLAATNNLPEITGRVCPALCEFACVLGINDNPVTIRENELSVIEEAFAKGYVKPNPPKARTGKKVAVIGSGPAGLAAADQLNKAGHKVTVFEKDDRIGGLMRYGIPDFKLDKKILDRRIDIWKKEGIEYKTKTNVGIDLSIEKLQKDYDAICLAGGARLARDLNIAGRDLQGIHFAMDFLAQSNRRVAKDKVKDKDLIDAKGKTVVVVGGGDTGSDCVGTAQRQGAKCVVQIEVMPKPQEERGEEFPWPKYPMLLKTSSSHEEGCDRDWAILTKKFTGSDGKVEKIECVRVAFNKKDENDRPIMQEVYDSSFEIDADLVFLAIGFISPEHQGLLDDLKVEYDPRGNVKTDNNMMSSVDGIFSAGDMRRGQSLIVWAIQDGRSAAYNIDKYLMGDSYLPKM